MLHSASVARPEVLLKPRPCPGNPAAQRKAEILYLESLEPRRLLSVLLDVGDDLDIFVEDPLNLQVDFTDNDIAQTHTATIDWGDGSPIEVGQVDSQIGGGVGNLFASLDYSLDTNNFFDTPDKRNLLQFVADTLLSRLGDDLQSIIPSAGNTWDMTFTHPATGNQHLIANPSVANNEIVIFAGGRGLSGPLGVGGPGGFSASGTGVWLDRVSTRGETGASGNSPTDLGIWGGSVTFDSGTDWHFDMSDEGLGFSESDFLSVAFHEVGHLLGIGTSDSWDAMIQGSSFTGAASVAEFDDGGNVPLSGDLGHWQSGTLENGQEVAMDPELTNGERKFFTELDWAALDDVGWDLSDPIGIVGTVSGTHTYALPDDYTVTVTVTDSDTNATSDSLLVSAVIDTSATIGDSVWLDADADGVFDNNESGIAGVTLDIYLDENGDSLLDGGDTLLDTVATDVDGFYNFTDLAAGKYIVDLTDTDGLTGGLHLTTAATVIAVDLARGEDFDDANFGFFNATVSGQVWNDADADGLIDNNESGIAGVTLDIYRDENGDALLDGGDTLVDTVTADVDGVYSFSNLGMGKFLINLTDTGNVLDGFLLTTVDTVIPADLTLPVDVADVDFGYFNPGDLRFGNVDGAKNVKLIFQDITYTLRGAGTGVVQLQDLSDFSKVSIDFTGTETKSNAKFSKAKRQSFEIIDIHVAGAMGKVDMRTGDLLGDYTSTKSTTSLTARDIDAVHTITIGPADVDVKIPGFSLTARDVIDTSLISAIPVKKIKVNTWENTDAAPDAIAAPSANTIQSAVNFQADITLSDTEVDIKTTLNKLQVKRLLSDLVIRSAGNVGNIIAGAMSGVSLFAGIDGAETALPDVAGDFLNSNLIVKKVQLKGLADLDNDFVDSRIAGATLKSVILNRVDNNNSLVPLGVAADSVGSLRYIIGGESVKARKLIDPATQNISNGDFELRLFDLIV
jgi:hypothetical protein